MAAVDRVPVFLSPDDWNRVMALLAQGPWNVVNPLLMEIGEQLRGRQGAAPAPDEPINAKGMTQ